MTVETVTTPPVAASPAAIVALVGWTILELLILWVVGIFRRRPA